MVGGKVIGIARRNDGTSLLHVQGTGQEVNDHCSVRCSDPQGVANLKDGVWWQAGKVFVTANAVTHTLKKIGYSH